MGCPGRFVRLGAEGWMEELGKGSRMAVGSVEAKGGAGGKGLGAGSSASVKSKGLGRPRKDIEAVGACTIGATDEKLVIRIGLG
jgi:hypothetical protein